MDFVLWGVKIGDQDWQENIISTKPENFENAVEWAKKNGFDRFRISNIENVNIIDAFKKAINI
jgi:hypothetical protein